MQIQSRSVSSAALRWNAPASTPASISGETVAPLSESETVLATAGVQGSFGGDGMREPLESFFQVEMQDRIDTTVSSTEGAANLSSGTVRAVRRAVAIEIRQGRTDLAKLETGDLGGAERRDLQQARRELKRVEQQFNRELKDLGPNADLAELSNGSEGVLGSVQESFDRMVARLASLAEKVFESVLAQPATSEGGVAALAETPPAEFSEALRDSLTDFADRFEAFIESLSASLSSGAPIPRPAKPEQGASEESAPASEYAVSSYTSIRFELSVEVSGSALNLAS